MCKVYDLNKYKEEKFLKLVKVEMLKKKGNSLSRVDNFINILRERLKYSSLDYVKELVKDKIDI